MELTGKTPSPSHDAPNEEEIIILMLELYAKDLPRTANTFLASPPDTSNRVNLTGSTGTIGSHLLTNILANPAIAHIYCFTHIHTSPLMERQRSFHNENGLPAHFPLVRVTFHETDLSQPYFGLPRPTYRKLLTSVTHVIYNAWEVNFNLSIQSFQYLHINRVRQFIDFSSSSKYGAFIFFISTISTATIYSASHTGPMLESVIDEFSLPQAIGYADSKYVAERLFDEAARVSGVRSAICRARQDPKGKGVWRTEGYFPSLIKSVLHMGCLPRNLRPMDRVDWVPIDVLAECTGELVFILGRKKEFSHPNSSATNRVSISKLPTPNSRQPPSTKVYYLVSPTPTTYTALLRSILSSVPPSMQPKLITFKERMTTLHTSDPTRNPQSKC